MNGYNIDVETPAEITLKLDTDGGINISSDKLSLAQIIFVLQWTVDSYNEMSEEDFQMLCDQWHAKYQAN